MRFEPVIRKTLNRFRQIGIEALFPNLDIGIEKADLDLDLMRSLCQDEFKAIDDSDSLYVLNVGGYVGRLVAVEIGYAIGRRKPVYLCEKADDIDLEAIVDGVVSLDNLDFFLE